MNSHPWQLLDEHAAAAPQAGPTAHDQALAGTGALTGTGATLASPSRTVYAAGHAATAAAAIEEAFGAAELRVLTSPAPFVLLAGASQELRFTPAPASVEQSLGMLAELRHDLLTELQRAGR
ncbi:hypothetical protein ACQEU1_45115 [Lentzea sp. CA-135723]